MIVKCIRSFRYAFKGIYSVFKNENNAKVHSLATVLALTAGAYFKISSGEWLWILLSIALVWAAEAFNTAIEKLTNIVSPQYNPEAGEVKDISAGAVLVCALFALCTGLIIFIPKLLKLINF